MNPMPRLLICHAAALVLCQCSSGDKKPVKRDTSSMTLAQRSMLKPDENQRSQYEKFITNPKNGKGNAGSWFQKQVHHSKSYSGGDSYAGQKPFKTGRSWFGKSKAQGIDTTYALGDKTASGVNNSFKTDASRLGGKQSGAGDAVFNGADNVFGTGSALSRSQYKPKVPMFIENYNENSSKKSAYTEDEVKKLLNRN